MENKLIKRPNYLRQLIEFRDKDLIKVITGIRRSGKSTLFELYKNYLMRTGVSSSQIISINLEQAEFNSLTTSQNLYDHIEKRLVKGQMNYVFIDEVQQIEGFQKACDNLYVKDNVDLYITGSNASLLSGELATLLSGRYIEIKMMPLSFREYISAVGKEDLVKKYNDYISQGAFPYLLYLNTEADKRAYLDGLYNTIIVKDIAKRRGITNITQLETVIRYIFDNIGNESSSTNIANILKKANKTVSAPTIDNYLKYLTESFVIYRADRYDIKGKQLLENSPKYYVTDLGLRNYLLGNGSTDYGHILENVVFLELLRKGYDIRVGRTDKNEVDFIVKTEKGLEYIQVAYTAIEEKTLERELSSLRAINDGYPKLLLTMDQVPEADFDGIKRLNVLEWLLK